MTAAAPGFSAPAAPGFRVAIAPRRQRRAGWQTWLLLAVTITVAFLLMVWSRIALDHTAFVLQEVEGQMTVEESRYWDMRLEAARLQAPDRIIDAAVEMGMAYPVTLRTVEVAGLGGEGTETEERWVGLKAVLGAQP